MPWKLLLFVFCVVFVTVFIGFNLDYKANVSLVFYTFENVPVFMVMLFSFCAGVLLTVPFAFRAKSPKDPKAPKASGASKGAKGVPDAKPNIDNL